MLRLPTRFISKLPLPLRIICYVIVYGTLVYLLFFMIYCALSIIQKVVSFLFDKRNYWTFVVCVLILLIGSLLIAQFVLGLNPFGKFIDYVIQIWENIKNGLIDLMS